MHVSASALSKEINTTWQILNIFTSFSFIAVPLFFMISGAVILSSPNTENPWYTLRKRIPKLLIPLIVWSMIALLPAFLVPENTQNGFQFINYFKSALAIPAKNVAVHLWYMYFLIPLYLLSPFLRVLVVNMKKENIQFLFVLWISNILLITFRDFLPEGLQAYAHIDFLERVHLISGYLGFFFAGYYLHQTHKEIPLKILLANIILFALIIILGTSVFSIRASRYISTFQSVGSIFITVLAISVFLLFKQIIRKEKSHPCITILATNSFSIYLMHNIFISLFSNYIWTYSSSFGAFATVIITLFVCNAISILLSSMQPISYCFTGIKYHDACKSCNIKYIKKIVKSKYE